MDSQALGGRGGKWEANDNVAAEEIAKVAFSILTRIICRLLGSLIGSRILAFHRQSCNSKQIPERAHSKHALIMRKKERRTSGIQTG